MNRNRNNLSKKEECIHSHSPKIFTEEELLRQWRTVSPPELTMTMGHALSTVMETADVDRVIVKLSNQINEKHPENKNDITSAEAKQIVYDFSEIFVLMEKKVKDSQEANLLFRLEFQTELKILLLRFKNIFKISEETALVNDKLASLHLENDD